MKIVKKVWAIIENSDWKILIFKEKLDWKEYLYNIPKWTFDLEKDKTLWKAVMREIYEETNLKDTKIIDIINLYPKYYDDYISILILFKVTFTDDINNISNINIENNENIKDYKFIDSSDFKNLKKEDFIDNRIYQVLKNIL